MQYESQEHFEDDMANQAIEDEGRATEEANAQGEADAQAHKGESN